MTTSDYQGTPDGLTEAWRSRIDIGQPTAFPVMVDALRKLQDQLTGSNPPEQVANRIAESISALTRELARYAVDERHQVAGRLTGIPGRGQCMTPAVEITEYSGTHARGHVSFGRFYLGGNGAVHGGAIPLVFDELMGRLANTGGRPPSRTAYLHVNYRNITPIETSLAIEARFDSEQGRKRILSGTIRDGDTICADAEGLFVALRPGQP
ncbi:MAG TPA: PaaI family thioesterase [Trebonia sp.]|jgi:acyl-coenzyme A thioesterase PaaI-like protein